MDGEQREQVSRDVMDALVGHDERMRRLYAGSPEFHASIRMIGTVMPILLEAMADSAENVLLAHQLMTQEIDHRLFPTDPPEDD